MRLVSIIGGAPAGFVVMQPRGLAARAIAACAAIVLALGVASSARADGECYDVFGCIDKDTFRLSDLMDGPNCDFLWTMRNQVFKDHGYCFQTDRGISTFGNDGCITSNTAALGLNRFERANVTTIARAEKAKGCQ